MFDTVPRPCGIGSGAVTLEEDSRRWSPSSDVTFSYDGRRPAVERSQLHRRARARPSPWSARPARANPRPWRCSIASTTRNPAASRIDGRDIRDIKLASLRRNIGVIFQEPLLFNRSIADNLRVGNPDATDADILRGHAERAQALEFIERQRAGL